MSLRDPVLGRTRVILSPQMSAQEAAFVPTIDYIVVAQEPRAKVSGINDDSNRLLVQSLPCGPADIGQQNADGLD